MWTSIVCGDPYPIISLIYLAEWRMKQCWTEEPPLLNMSVMKRKWKVRRSICPNISIHWVSAQIRAEWTPFTFVRCVKSSNLVQLWLSAKATKEFIWRHPRGLSETLTYFTNHHLWVHTQRKPRQCSWLNVKMFVHFPVWVEVPCFVSTSGVLWLTTVKILSKISLQPTSVYGMRGRMEKNTLLLQR